MISYCRDLEEIGLDATLGQMDQSNSSGIFSNEDRKQLYQQGAQLELLMRDFHDMRRELRDNDSPSAKEFAELRGQVAALQNFRWYLMGGAMIAVLFGHLMLSKIGL